MLNATPCPNNTTTNVHCNNNNKDQFPLTFETQAIFISEGQTCDGRSPAAHAPGFVDDALARFRSSALDLAADGGEELLKGVVHWKTQRQELRERTNKHQ